MRKILFLLASLYIGLMIPEIQAEAATRPVSHGTVIYTAGGENAGFYAADILLLEEKISSIPNRCFDPAYYAHIHQWEYCEINERTHTRHCADCGKANDLTGFHSADRWEDDTLYYEGETYPARRFICACGYQWTLELTHAVVYEAVDEQTHRGRCVLEDTAYCRGYEPSAEEHYAWYYEMGEDALHHRKICFDCGFSVGETCSFAETEEEGRRICICGREVGAEPPDHSDGTETGEDPDVPDGTETGEDPDAPDGAETGEDPDAPDGTETGEDPDAPDGTETGEDPDAPDGTETGEDPDAPGETGTGGDSDKPDAPGETGTGGDSDKSDAPGETGTGGDSDKPDVPDGTGTGDKPDAPDGT